jgi:hypothetical protein
MVSNYLKGKFLFIQFLNIPLRGVGKYGGVGVWECGSMGVWKGRMGREGFKTLLSGQGVKNDLRRLV